VEDGEERDKNQRQGDEVALIGGIRLGVVQTAAIRDGAYRLRHSQSIHLTALNL
jgi:hypothetical protein